MCQLYRTLIFCSVYQYQMLQKPAFTKVSAIKLQPLHEQVLTDRFSLPKNSKITIQSPRFNLHIFEDPSLYQTQKPKDSFQPITNRNKLPHLTKIAPILKENLFDLDAYFNRQCPQFSQSSPLRQNKGALMPKGCNLSIRSKRKNTNSTDSQESSFERISKEETDKAKKATESPDVNKKDKRGKSQAKTTCRVLKSKKIPFQIRTTGTKTREVSINLDLDLSVIQKREQTSLLSADSFQSFFMLPFK